MRDAEQVQELALSLICIVFIRVPRRLDLLAEHILAAIADQRAIRTLYRGEIVPIIPAQAVIGKVVETCAVVIVGNVQLGEIGLRQHPARRLAGSRVCNIVQHNAFHRACFPAHLPAGAGA